MRSRGRNGCRRRALERDEWRADPTWNDAKLAGVFLLSKLTTLEIISMYSDNTDVRHPGAPMNSRITAVAASASLVPRASLARHARLVLALGALATAACARADASATNGEETSAPVPVVVQTVTPSMHAASTTTSGIVHANTSVDVGFEVPG